MALAARPPASPGWVLDEVGSAGRENLDVGHVARYDEKEDAAAAGEAALLVELGLDGRSQVVTSARAPVSSFWPSLRCAPGSSVDVSPVMLERLRAKVAASALVNVEAVQAGFLTYEHQGPAVDFVYSRWALHHLADFWKALALHRMRTILRPGGWSR